VRMFDPAVAIAIGLVVDETDLDAKVRRGARVHRASALGPMLLAVVLMAIFLLAGCDATSRGVAHRPHTATVTPLYESPIGGPTVYRIESPDGRETVIVTPIYQSPTGGSDVYRIERRP
jgi:hypothetical protein